MKGTMHMTWFDDMATAMRHRETALNGVKRWEAKLALAEDVIARLGATAPAAPAAAPAAEPTPAPAPVASAPEAPSPVLEGPIDVNWA